MAQRVGPAELGSATSSDVVSSADSVLATSRREFLQILIGGSTLVIGGVFLTAKRAAAGPGDTSDFFDVGDSLVASESSYKYNLTLEVTAHNRVRFELPRQDKGQGIATALAMIIADEMDADYDRTDVVLGDARADRPYTITGGSCTMRSLWEPARAVAANARTRLVAAAALRWGVAPTTLTTAKSMVLAPDGRRANYGELSAEAAAINLPVGPTTLKPLSALTIVGTRRGRKNARAIVTGAQKYTLDLGVDEGIPADAVLAVVARAPEIKGTVVSVNNQSVVEDAFGVDVVEIPRFESQSSGSGVTPPVLVVEGGVAVAGKAVGVPGRARTFKEAFDARDALSISWADGPLHTTSDGQIRNTLLTLVDPFLPLPDPLPPGLEIHEATFDFPYIAHGAMEVMTAVADVRANSAEIWYASQTPLYAAQMIAEATGIPEANVTLHVPFAGGAFGRHLFAESAVEAALISQALGRPIKLLWTRNDDMRHGRFRPITHHKLRATWQGAQMLTYEHRIAAAEMDLRHGIGDAMTAGGFDLTHQTIGQAAFGGTVSVLYDFDVTDQRIAEHVFQVPTGSWRSIYSGFTMTANEIFIDEVARALGEDEVQFRLDHLDSVPASQCLDKVVRMAGFLPGQPLPPNMGVAVHAEYRSAVAYLVEIENTGSGQWRLKRAFAAVDAGVPVNPRGLEAQMQGALIDGFSATFRASNHLDNGVIREGTFSDFLWARMNHAPYLSSSPDVSPTEVYVFPATRETPGGAGELGFPPAAAACANAYARATGIAPHRFPIQEFPNGE